MKTPKGWAIRVAFNAREGRDGKTREKAYIQIASPQDVEIALPTPNTVAGIVKLFEAHDPAEYPAVVDALRLTAIKGLASPGSARAMRFVE